MSITLETKTWENDWELVVKHQFLRTVMERFKQHADKRVLFINNVLNPSVVARAADRLIANEIIDEYIFVSQHADNALEHFGLTREALGKGYNYSIAELVSIFLCSTKYLAHFSSDTTITEDVAPHWLSDATSLLAERGEVSVVNLTWDQKYSEALKDSDYQDDNYFYGYGFSDQMYVIEVEEFNKKIYDFEHPASERYPKYAGALFEKRVDSYMRVNARIRATYRHASYIHKNFPKPNTIRRWIWTQLNKPKN